MNPPISHQPMTQSSPQKADSATGFDPGPLVETCVRKQLFFEIESEIYSISEEGLKQSGQLHPMLNSEHLGMPNEGTLEFPIHLEGITKTEMESFLRVLNARVWDGPITLTTEQWAGALHVATMYDFPRVRSYIVTRMEEEDPVADPILRIELANKCQVFEWLHPMYIALCERRDPISIDEAERLGLRVYVALSHIREQQMRDYLSRLRKEKGTTLSCDHHRSNKYGWYPLCVLCIPEQPLSEVHEEVTRLVMASEALKIPTYDA